jgi:hypothetical protein
VIIPCFILVCQHFGEVSHPHFQDKVTKNSLSPHVEVLNYETVENSFVVKLMDLNVHGVAIKFSEQFYCVVWSETCDLIVVKTCLCMFQLSPVTISMH